MGISRRTFIRVVGGIGLTPLVPFRYAVGAENAAAAASGILVEAASFAKQSGWKLDTQHYQQMGGCYLLAHVAGKRESLRLMGDYNYPRLFTNSMISFVAQPRSVA